MATFRQIEIFLLLADELHFGRAAERMQITQAALSKDIKEKEKSVIIKRFGLDGKAPMSLSEIGAEMGYSKERIRQIEVQGLSLLKNCFEHNAYRPDRKLVI